MCGGVWLCVHEFLGTNLREGGREEGRKEGRAGRAAGAYVIGLTTTLPAERIADYCDEVHPTLAQIDLDDIINKLRSR